jgi:hypothetical protein
MVAAGIESNPVKPGREPAFTAKGADPVGERHGNLLRHILGLCGIAEEPIRHAIERVVVALQQVLKRRSVAILGTQGQVKVARAHVFRSLDERGVENLGAQSTNQFQVMIDKF